MSRISLPRGSHYAVAWGLEETHGGMTSAMLHRCRAFVRLGDTPVTILTYAAGGGHREAETALRESGKLDDRIVVRNFWDDVAAWSDEEIHAHASCGAASIGGSAAPALEPTSQSDYVRPDGSLLVSDHREESGRRQVTLWDSWGRPGSAYNSMWRLYHCWLDTLPREPRAFFIVDSKTSARHFSRYQGRDAVKIHLLHGSHLLGGQRPHGPANPDREYAAKNVKRWDAFVFLTQQQREDFHTVYGGGARLNVCPNGRAVPAELVNPRRKSHRGAVLARLDEGKRVPHAIEAMSRASTPTRRLLPRRRPHLDVYGDGDIPAHEALAAGLDPRPSVRFHGFVTDAHVELRDASFSLLTSTNEGQGLVLIESMAAGCIPISYDIPYGPSDLITDGVDGFLVPDGDIDALAERIRFVATARPAELEPMRRAAHRRARDFTDVKVTRTWARVLRKAARHHRKRSRRGADRPVTPPDDMQGDIQGDPHQAEEVAWT